MNKHPPKSRQQLINGIFEILRELPCELIAKVYSSIVARGPGGTLVPGRQDQRGAKCEYMKIKQVLKINH